MDSRLQAARATLVLTIVAALCLALAGLLAAPELVLVSGLLLVVVGVRIAYNHRGAGDSYLRAIGYSTSSPYWGVRPETRKMIDGSIIASLGVALLYLALRSLLS
jgi:hypothetical protein